MRIKRKSIGKYSGPVINGTVPYQVPIGPKRAQIVYRAHWLTAKVETGAKFGAIMMADGTAVTAGLDQFALVYPKEVKREDFNAVDDQGVLGKLLRRIELVGDAGFQEACVLPLWLKFKGEGIYLAQDGLFRYAVDHTYTVGNKKLDVKAGDIVHGATLQDIFTPNRGVVSGPEWTGSETWAGLFHKLFSHEATFKIQEEFGAERMVKNMRRRTVRKGVTAANFFFGDKDLTAIEASDIPRPVELAFAVWYSHSVNAPSTAMWFIKRYKEMNEKVAPKLIRSLALSSYGRWHWSILNGRYQRTRSAARNSGLWPKSCFDGRSAVMPAEF